jgi:hypothetical protein
MSMPQRELCRLAREGVADEQQGQAYWDKFVATVKEIEQEHPVGDPNSISAMRLAVEATNFKGQERNHEKFLEIIVRNCDKQGI